MAQEIRESLVVVNAARSALSAVPQSLKRPEADALVSIPSIVDLDPDHLAHLGTNPRRIKQW